MDRLGNKNWWKASAVRTIKTFAEALIAQIAVGQGFGEIGWPHVLSVSGVAALIAFATCFAGLPEVTEAEK